MKIQPSLISQILSMGLIMSIHARFSKTIIFHEMKIAYNSLRFYGFTFLSRFSYYWTWDMIDIDVGDGFGHFYKLYLPTLVSDTITQMMSPSSTCQQYLFCGNQVYMNSPQNCRWILQRILHRWILNRNNHSISVQSSAGLIRMRVIGTLFQIQIVQQQQNQFQQLQFQQHIQCHWIRQLNRPLQSRLHRIHWYWQRQWASQKQRKWISMAMRWIKMMKWIKTALTRSKPIKISSLIDQIKGKIFNLDLNTWHNQFHFRFVTVLPLQLPV